MQRASNGPQCPQRRGQASPSKPKAAFDTAKNSLTPWNGEGTTLPPPSGASEDTGLLSRIPWAGIYCQRDRQSLNQWHDCQLKC